MKKNISWLKYSLYQPILIVLVAAVFYLYDFFLRVSPSVITQELMVFYDVGANVLGPMLSSFFLAYTLMQIPSGLLGDRFGPRIILTIAAALCSLATFLFVSYNYIGIGFVARFLIGCCASFAYIAPLMLAARWFDAKYFALICGFIQMMGCLGAIIGGAPVVYFTDMFGWQQPLLWAAWLGLGLAVLFFLVIKDAPKNKKCFELKNLTTESVKALWALKRVCYHKQSWAIGVIGFAAWAPIAMFAELWGVSFLEAAYDLETLAAAKYMRYIWFGIAVGGPTLGWLSHKLKSRKLPLLSGLGLSFFASWLIIYYHVPINLLAIILFVFGFAASCQCVTFGAIRDIHPLSVSGTAVGFNNMAVIFGGILCQPTIGVILENYWDNTWAANGAHAFTVHAYEMAFLLIPCCVLLGIVSTVFIFKETNCEQQY